MPSTQVLRKLVATHAVKHAFRFVGDKDETARELATVKSWKRRSKSKLSTHLSEFGATAAELETDPDLQYEHVDRLDPTPLTDACVARHFEHDEFEDSLDCLVVTTPDDATVIGLFWHSD